ncbi:MAG: DNA polymerase I [Acidobacteria bacterium RIFCSPLOWO2_02_FULL_67_36]|nr:MAG: DNA polymerase I [Acidobacteria bacterium RIFCSPLOWO2_02_FULL_67_36]OFW20773.1 MAG: DNA polymerase I [Acidobacteria bacterium RIFCSPLOWO2_12_FULL_66_21]
MSSPPRIFLIDGSSQMYRAYHAMRGSGLTGPGGRSTHAVYIFVTMLRKLIQDHQPQYLAASFDLAGPTFRDEMVADYKANRAPMPADLAEQIPWVHEACEAMGVPILTYERFEADDVIGTLATKATAEGFEVAIVTGDKDFFQLVHDGLKVYNPRDEGTWYDAAGVKEKFGVAPEQVVDVLALMGDSIDNIKGVPGIGDKGARDLIATYGSLDNLLAHAAEISNKRYREGLLTGAEDARQSRELARIRTDVPVEFVAETLRYRGVSRERCFELFGKLGFRSLVMEYAPTADTIGNDYAVVDTVEGVRALAAELREAGRFGFRLLPDAPSAMRSGIAGLAFSMRPRHARYVPTSRRAGESDLFGDGGGTADARPGVGVQDALAELKGILEDARLRKAGHDLKFDAIVLERHGVALAGIETDTMLASYLLDATRSAHPLEELAIEHAGYKALREEDVCGRGARAIPFADLPLETALDYAGERSDLALQLSGTLRALVRRESLETLYDELELPLIPVLVAIERAGVRIDGPALAGQSQHVDQELASRSAQIFELAGEQFNINSPQQLSKILFDKLQLPTLKRNVKTKTASTSVEVLEELALAHDLPRLILEWRALQKLKGTYIDALPQLVNPDTGRVHTCFNQAVAATGRLSSSDPNLQNIPIRTELGREIRRAFVAERDHVLISADYSQIELRVLAHLSGDEALVEAFRRGEDIHDRTARKVFGADSGLGAHELRRRAKIINYALLYGKTAYTLAKDIGVTQQAAQEFINAYFAGFPGVRAFIDNLLAEARETGVVKTMFGRRRLVPELASRNGQIRNAAERVAVNLPIQGTAADILKKAMIDVHAALPALAGGRVRMILTVHDELLFEAPRDAAEDAAARVRDLMEAAVELKVPLTVDVGIGENWKEAKA